MKQRLQWQLNFVLLKSPEDISGSLRKLDQLIEKGSGPEFPAWSWTHHGPGIEFLSHVTMHALVFLEFLFTFICRLDNLLVSARIFPDSVIFWCQAALQNAVAEQSNAYCQSSCKNQGIIREIEP
ncbi:hypothetical protein RHGRI_038492 [Rhododendron griersonianum]|uniref:Uncharacterized protein n=1 Tax=Rhododendron griersonianum TaxID=479676 RepID=A0AAV6HN98_9ERIC|nr:hypothetical protein RHGRI_038492 [Rhododendron griersonianum]